MYTQETADAVCAGLIEGKSLRAVCREPGMPTVTTVMRWLAADEAFREQYARAVHMRADAKFEELDDVSEDAVLAETAVQVQGLRLKADNIKWQLARMNSKKYGDRQVIAGDPEAPLHGSIGLSAETARLLAELSTGPSGPGVPPPVPD